MADGVKNLWNEKWPSIIAILIGAITGFILINILTGGALMLALPFLIQAIGVIFAGVGIYGMLSHFKNYLSSSWAGKIVKGGKHLARALAMLAIEAVFALMFGGKAAFKAVKSGAKSIAKNGVKASLKSGAKLAKTTAKNGLKSGVQGAKRFKRIVGAGTQRAGKNLAKGGKFMVSGVRKGAMKGAKSLKSVVKNLSKKLKFDKYRFTLKGRKFKLEGHLNPWVLFANGELDYIDSKDLNKAKVGDKVNVSGRGDAFVIGSKNTSKAKSAKEAIEEGSVSKYVDDLVEISDEKELLKGKYKLLDEHDSPRDLIYNRSDPAWFKDPNISDKAKEAAKDRGDLRKNMKTKTGDEAHHAVTVGMIGKNKVVQDAIDAGFAFNTKANGINLSKCSKTLKLKGVHANHPDYDVNVNYILKKFGNTFLSKPNYNKNMSKAFSEKLADKLIKNINETCIAKNIKVNDLFNVIDRDKLYKEIIKEIKNELK